MLSFVSGEFALLLRAKLPQRTFLEYVCGVSLAVRLVFSSLSAISYVTVLNFISSEYDTLSALQSLRSTYVFEYVSPCDCSAFAPLSRSDAFLMLRY